MLGGISQKYSKNAHFQSEIGRNLTKIIEKCPLSFARIRKNMYLCIKRYAVARVKTVGQFGRTLIIPKDYERFEEHLKLLVVMMHDSAA